MLSRKIKQGLVEEVGTYVLKLEVDNTCGCYNMTHGT